MKGGRDGGGLRVEMDVFGNGHLRLANVWIDRK